MTDWWLALACAFAAVAYVGWGVTLVSWRADRRRWERHRCAAEAARGES